MGCSAYPVSYAALSLKRRKAMVTVLELTREGWAPYIAALSRRPAPPELSPEEQRERKQLLARIRQAAAKLKMLNS